MTATPSTSPISLHRPTLMELGHDLTRISPFRCGISLLGPFAWSLGFFVLAAQQQWILAVVCLVVLSFITYGSVSHDLVHRNLGLSKRANDLLLVLIELLALRSGTAYRLAHLNHHRRFPADDDIEGAAAKLSFVGALGEGIRFQVKIYRWAWKKYPHYRKQLHREGVLVAVTYVVSVLVLPWSISLFVYVALMTAGAWIIPLITSWIPHDPRGQDAVHQTRAFRGIVLKILAWEHLYHLEHHLYPAVPHQNWPELARRLDPFLRASGVRTVRLWY